MTVPSSDSEPVMTIPSLPVLEIRQDMCDLPRAEHDVCLALAIWDSLASDYNSRESSNFNSETAASPANLSIRPQMATLFLIPSTERRGTAKTVSAAK